MFYKQTLYLLRPPSETGVLLLLSLANWWTRMCVCRTNSLAWSMVIIIFDIKLPKPDNSALQQLGRNERPGARLLDWPSGPRDKHRPLRSSYLCNLHLSNVAKSEEGLKSYNLVEHNVFCNNPMHVMFVQVVKEVHTPSGTYTERVLSWEGGWATRKPSCVVSEQVTSPHTTMPRSNVQDWSPHMSFILKGSQISAFQLKGWFKSKTSSQEYENEVHNSY